MTPRVVVLSLGMPRSGTTLVQKMLELGTGYFHQKVCEFHPWHPMNSPELIRLVNTFRHKTVVVARTIRPVEDVVESLMVGREMGNPHDWTPERTRELHAQERQNFRTFLSTYEEQLDAKVTCAPVDVEYDHLGNREARQRILHRLGRHVPDAGVNRAIWSEYLEQVWGKHPVNVGRLMRERMA